MDVAGIVCAYIGWEPLNSLQYEELCKWKKDMVGVTLKIEGSKHFKHPLATLFLNFFHGQGYRMTAGCYVRITCEAGDMSQICQDHLQAEKLLNLALEPRGDKTTFIRKLLGVECEVRWLEQIKRYKGFWSKEWEWGLKELDDSMHVPNEFVGSETRRNQMCYRIAKKLRCQEYAETYKNEERTDEAPTSQIDGLDGSP